MSSWKGQPAAPFTPAELLFKPDDQERLGENASV